MIENQEAQGEIHSKRQVWDLRRISEWSRSRKVAAAGVLFLGALLLSCQDPPGVQAPPAPQSQNSDNQLAPMTTEQKGQVESVEPGGEINP
jgi:hypothetical protein